MFSMHFLDSIYIYCRRGKKQQVKKRGKLQLQSLVPVRTHNQRKGEAGHQRREMYKLYLHHIQYIQLVLVFISIQMEIHTSQLQVGLLKYLVHNQLPMHQILLLEQVFKEVQVNHQNLLNHSCLRED